MMNIYAKKLLKYIKALKIFNGIDIHIIFMIHIIIIFIVFQIIIIYFKMEYVIYIMIQLKEKGILKKDY